MVITVPADDLVTNGANYTDMFLLDIISMGYYKKDITPLR